MAQNTARAVTDGTAAKKPKAAKSTKSTKSTKTNKSSAKNTSSKKSAAKTEESSKGKNGGKYSAKAKTTPKHMSEPEEVSVLEQLSPYANEIVGIAFAGMGLLLITFLFSDSSNKNLATYTTAFFGHLLGFGGVILPFLLIAAGVLIFMNKQNLINKTKACFWVTALLSALALTHIIVFEDGSTYGGLSGFIRNFFLNGSSENGGLTGALIGGALVRLIGKPGACVVCVILLAIMAILIFNVSIFKGLQGLYALMTYRDDYEDDLEDDYEPEPVRRKAVKSQILEEYDIPAAKEEEEPVKEKGGFFTKRLERPVFDKPDEIKSKSRKKLTVAAEPEDEYESPYHVDKSGRVLGIDLYSTRKSEAEPISLYPSKPYDPNDDESDINALFVEDSEAEYDKLLREAEDLFKADEAFDTAFEEVEKSGINSEDIKSEEIRSEEIRPETERSVQAQPIRKAVPTEDADIPPWEEPADRPQIIAAEEIKELDKLQVEQTETYQFPKLEFLGLNPNTNRKQTEAEMIAKGEKLRQTLATFGVEARVDNICTGPTVTRYELIPKQGTRVNAIVKLEQDIALALAAATVRIEAPIPGKSAIGIEIPNDTIQSVYYSEVLRTEKFQSFKSKIGFGIGKDIAGNVVVYDIAKAPHMLIAGATGAGKSVCINTLITSILYKATPDEVRLIMVDPKVVELSVYNGIPHLLIPVVTDPKQAAGALNWAVREMMRRYDLFATTGTRNLQGYNAREDVTEKLPQIVIIIDELADLMMIAKKAVEEAICRIAQLARAAGIHLIIATQRPSVDVITGLIKANIPTRIAFKVSSGMDSRTVLDTTGAEKLLGRGDMLFRAVDMNKPLRIQGAFVTDEEVAKIVDYIKTDVPNYDKSVLEDIERAENADSEGSVDIETNSSDELIDQVIDFIVHTKKASTSAIQRKFRIGFNRAGRIIDELEDRGIVGPENGSKPREVLMTPYERSEYKERHENY